MGAGELIVAIDGVAYGLLLFAVAAGLTLTLGVAGSFNLAHGVLYLTGAYCGWRLADGTWVGLAAGLAVGVGAGAVIGAVLAVLLGMFSHHLEQALASIGMALIMGQVLTAVFGAEPLAVNPPAAVAGSIILVGQAYPVYRILFIVFGTVLAFALWWTVTRTRTGAVVRATAADPDMVAMLGIEPRRVHMAVTVTGACLAIAAGVLGGPVLGPAPGVDHIILILSLAIVVAGGVGSIPGTLLAALTVGQIQTTAVSSLPTAAPYLVFALLAVALTARTLFSRRIRPA
jgi:branched-subunit amino acid ABC-type transport system permease component